MALKPFNGTLDETPSLKPFKGKLDQPAGAEAPSVGVGDYLKALGGSIVGATGGAVRGAAEALGTSPASNLPAANILRQAGDAVGRAGARISGSVSDTAAQRMAGSMPSGNIADPSSWSMGTDPSVSGYALNTLQGLGSIAPTVAAGIASRGRIAPAAAAGAVTGGGFAAQAEQERIANLPETELAKLPGYQQRLARMTPAEARADLAREAAASAFRYTAPVSAADALIEVAPFTGAVQRTLGRMVGTGRIRRAAAGLVTGAAAEGAQEVAEQAAQTIGADVVTGERRDPLEDSFANAVLGATIGGPLNAAAALATSPQRAAAELEEPRPEPQTRAEVQPVPVEVQQTVINPADGPLSRMVATEAADQSGSPVVEPVVVSTPLADQQALDQQQQDMQTATKNEQRATEAADAGKPTPKSKPAAAPVAPAAVPAAPPPAGMDPLTGEDLTRRDPAQVQAAITAELAARAGGVIDTGVIKGIANKLGVKPGEVSRVRAEMRRTERGQPAATAASTDGENAREQAQIPQQVPAAGQSGGGRDGDRSAGTGRSSAERTAVPAGQAQQEGRQENRQEGGQESAGPQGQRRSAPAQTRKGSEEGRQADLSRLTYDESTEQLDDDITPPSGNPFQHRGAADIQARRVSGGKVFAVDGGFVVRTPTETSNDSVAAQRDAAGASGTGATEVPAPAVAATNAAPVPVVAPTIGADQSTSGSGGQPAPASAGTAPAAAGRKDLNKGVPAELVAIAKAADDRSRAASAVLDAFPKGNMGLTPDATKKTPEWKAAKAESDAAIAALRKANAAVVSARKAGRKGASPIQNREVVANEAPSIPESAGGRAAGTTGGQAGTAAAGRRGAAGRNELRQPVPGGNAGVEPGTVAGRAPRSADVNGGADNGQDAGRQPSLFGEADRASAVADATQGDSLGESQSDSTATAQRAAAAPPQPAAAPSAPTTPQSASGPASAPAGQSGSGDQTGSSPAPVASGAVKSSPSEPEQNAKPLARFGKPEKASRKAAAKSVPEAEETPQIQRSNKELADKAIHHAVLPGKQAQGIPDAEIRIAAADGGYVYSAGFNTGTTGMGSPFNLSPVYPTPAAAHEAAEEEIRRQLPKKDMAAGEQARVEGIRKWLDGLDRPAVPKSEWPEVMRGVPESNAPGTIADLDEPGQRITKQLDDKFGVGTFALSTVSATYNNGNFTIVPELQGESSYTLVYMTTVPRGVGGKLKTDKMDANTVVAVPMEADANSPEFEQAILTAAQQYVDANQIDTSIPSPWPSIVKSSKPSKRAAKASSKTPEPTVPEPVPVAATPMEETRNLLTNLADGNATPDDVRATFARVRDNKDEVIAEIKKLTKPEIADQFGVRPDDKASMVDAAYRSLLSTFTLGTMTSFEITGDYRASHLRAVQAAVDKLAPADIVAYAEARQAAKQRREAAIAGMDNPTTLEDFQRLSAAVGGEAKLNATQRAEFDRLRTDALLAQRAQSAPTTVKAVDTGDTGMTLVETKHTQKGHDLFVVQLGDRVDREVYNRLNSAAKQLGGYYSAFRGRGAVPGFQFRTREAADKFMALREGDQDRSDQLAGRADAKREKQADTLGEKAAATRAAAQATLDKDRKTNTSRRAGMAASIEARARAELALADTMDKIAASIDAGTARTLAQVRHKSQVELLDQTMRTAAWDHQRAEGVSWEKAKEAPLTAEMMANATLPRFRLTRSDAVPIVAELRRTRGGKALADGIQGLIDYGDEFAAAVSENPMRFALARTDGKLAGFRTKTDAQRALANTAAGKTENMHVLPRTSIVKITFPDTVSGRALKKALDGPWLVVVSPEVAIERNLWHPDSDKKIAINAATAEKILSLLGTTKVPYWFEAGLERRGKFAAMGIDKDFLLREALREYMGLREAPAQEDPIRKMERDLIGNKSIGVDFFPTPPDLVAQLVETADIRPGNRVLEPSGGKGDIAEGVRGVSDDVTIDTVEISGTLREILEAKGFNVVADDFLKYTAAKPYDRIVMNPPFSNGLDADHVRHAYSMLAPQGRLVAITGEGIFSRNDKKATEFRSWLESVNGYSEKLPEGSFKSSFRPTGVATRMVVINRTPGAFSRREPNRPADMRTHIVGQNDLRQHVDKIVGSWRGDIPTVRVVQSAYALPRQVRLQSGWEGAEGWYDGRGTIYLVANNLPNLDRATQVLAHEAFGHYGVEGVIGKPQWTRIVGDVARLRRSIGTLPAPMAAAMASTERRYGAESPGTFAREFLAVMAERGVKSSLLARVLAGLRRFLREQLNININAWADAELRETLARGIRQVRRRAAPRQAEDRRGPAMSAAEDVEFVARTKGGEFRLTDSVAPAGTDVSEFGQIRQVQAFAGDQLVGRLVYANDGTPPTVEVNPSYRRQGVATAMMKLARQQGGVLGDAEGGIRGRGGEYRTPAGQAFRRGADEASVELVPAARGLFSLADTSPSTMLDVIAKAGSGPDGIFQRLKDKAEDVRPSLLGALTTRQLVEITAPYLPSGTGYMELADRMAARRNTLQAEIGDLAMKWERMQNASRRAASAADRAARNTDSDRATDLMHDSTIAGADGAEPYQISTITLNHNGDTVPLDEKSARAAIAQIENKLADKAWVKTAPDAVMRVMQQDIRRIEEGMAVETERRKAYPALKARFDALPKEWQALYREVRDAYVRRADQMQDALLARIESLEIDDRDKAALKNRMRANFESARIQAPYFPLARFGDYWASFEKKAADGTVERQFVMAETKRERDRLIRAAEAAGYTTAKRGRKIENVRAQDGASGGFVSEVNDILATAGVGESVRDEIYQLYLRTLPDLSTRKQFIHRKKVAGYDADALRAFASQMFHGAHQLARLEYQPRMADQLSKIEDDAKAAQDTNNADADRASAAAGEFKKRHEWIMNPTNASWVQTLSGLNFVFYLGVSPAAALVNLTQTAITTYPALAAKYGPIKALQYTVDAMRQAITRAVRDAGGQLRAFTKGETYDAQSTLAAVARTPDEELAYQQLQLLGAIDVTQSHDLAGLGDADTRGYNATRHRVMNAISFLFHKAEVVNREASAMASYRLAREAGKSHETAVKEAADTIWQTHFDYSAANRARFMQGDAAKVLLAFKQYSQSMTYFLWRAFYEAMKGESPQVRKEARNRLLGTLGMTGVFAGVMGMPLLSVGFGIANAMAAAFGDDDEPFDAETEFRNFIADMLGAKLGGIAQEGLVEGGLQALGLSAPEIGSRVSLNDLWIRNPDADVEGRDLYVHLLEQIAGPIVGAIGSQITAAGMISEGLQNDDSGMIWRGVEKSLPKAVRDGMKAIRYETQGVNTLRGDPLVENVGLLDSLYQGIGFVPAEVAQQYEVNASMKQYERYILDRRSALLDAYAVAMRNRDNEAMRATLERIRGFNKKNPEVAISANTIRRSMQSRQKFTERAVNGIGLNPKLGPRVREAIRFGGESE